MFEKLEFFFYFNQLNHHDTDWAVSYQKAIHLGFLKLCFCSCEHFPYFFCRWRQSRLLLCWRACRGEYWLSSEMCLEVWQIRPGPLPFCTQTGLCQASVSDCHSDFGLSLVSQWMWVSLISTPLGLAGTVIFSARACMQHAKFRTNIPQNSFISHVVLKSVIYIKLEI